MTGIDATEGTRVPDITTPDITIQELLSTTRAVRRRLDLTRDVDPLLLKECVEAAVQAPSGSNVQDWHFVFVRERDRRAALADLYRRAYGRYRQGPGYAGNISSAEDPDRAAVQRRVATSADYLAEHLHDVPILLVPCIRRRFPSEPSRAGMAGLYGSILPAVWSFMLAARSKGLGTAWTTMHLAHEEEAAQVLEIPYADVMQTALIPVAHYLGEHFRRAPRRPLEEVVSFDRFEQPPAW